MKVVLNFFESFADFVALVAVLFVSLVDSGSHCFYLIRE